MKKIKSILCEVVNDTLKGSNGKWSKSALTTFSAWVIAIYMALYSLYEHGFSYEVFITFVGVALGAKITDSISKKIHTPKDEGEK